MSARQDRGGSGDGFPVAIPFVVSPEADKCSHRRYVVGIPPHPGAFHTLAKLLAEALHSTCPPEKPHPGGGVRPTATRAAAGCPIRVVRYEPTGPLFTTSRGISWKR